MSVTVEIRGAQAGGGSGTNSNVPMGGAESSGGGMRPGSLLPSDERMIADVRREMQTRGVLLVPGSQGLSQIIGQYRKQLGEQAQKGVESQFQSRREALEDKARKGYEEIDRQLYDFYGEGLQSPDAKEREEARKQFQKDEELKYARWGKQIEKEEQSIDSEEQAAKSRVETELTDAIKRLTDALERESKTNPDVPDSYINRLRSQQKDLIKERDAAADEAGAIDASKRLAEVNERLRRAMTGEEGGGNKGKDGWGVALSGMRGIEQFTTAAGAGNLAGMISGAGGAGVGIASALGGLSLSQAAIAMGIVGAIAAIGGGIQQGAGRYDQISNLAAFRATVGGAEGREGGVQISPILRNSRFAGSDIYSISRLGLSETEFAQEAERRIRARGMSDDWFNEVYRQIGIERNFALRGGALMNAGAYDRYGISGSEATVRLINQLAGISGSGVSRGDFTRAQEKLDIQQQIMASYMNRNDRPNYDVANRTVAALSAVRGITQDSRIGQEYAVMQNALQNPMNDRMKALVYGVIEDIIPGTRGRMDKIDFALRDQKNEGQILQAVIQRVTQMYGGMDTQMGYFAFKNIFPGIAPERLKDYIRDFSNPESQASKILLGSLRGSEDLRYSNGQRLADRMAEQGTEYTAAVTQFLDSIERGVHGIFDWLSGNSRNGRRSANN